MRTTEQYSVTLPRGMAKIVEAKVTSGSYASISEIVREGVRSLIERDQAVEKWLRDEIVPNVRYMEAHPETAVPMHKAFAQIKERMKKSRPLKRK